MLYFELITFKYHLHLFALSFLSLSLICPVLGSSFFEYFCLYFHFRLFTFNIWSSLLILQWGNIGLICTYVLNYFINE